MEKKSYKLLAFFNFLGFFGVITINALANIIPINGVTTGEVSDHYANLFAPAGFTFSIWFIIYVLLGVFTIYQLGVGMKRPSSENDFIGQIGYAYCVSSIANMAWIISWHFDLIALSLVFMVVLLGSLIYIYKKLSIGKSNASLKIKQIVHIPFSIYLGWISVATIANVTTFLVAIGWDGFGISQAFWTIFVVLVGLLLGLYFVINRSDIFYGSVLVWAYFGILYKRYTVDGLAYRQLIFVLIASIVILLYFITKKIMSRTGY